MTPIEFLVSMPHGEARAAALTIYNLMTPVWIEITDDPATLPEMGQTVIVRMKSGNGGEMFGWRDGRFPDGWCWYQSKLANWHSISQSIEPASCEIGGYPTHWRPI